MLLKTMTSEGLAHHSYVVGDAGEAAVIDPSRDVERYIEFACQKGLKITRIFETHRNEDYISGAAELKKRTGATVLRGATPEYQVPYAQTAADGENFSWGEIRLKVLATPGHTDDSISVALFHTATGEDAVGVFTGDALFVDDVGRTDFYPDRAEEVAGLLYDSLHAKLLPLGDQAAIYPAHGAGSVCGSGMADREFSTIGYERQNNARLKLNRDAFIAAKVAEHHYYPPYFHRMENANQGDHPELQKLPTPWPLTVDELVHKSQAGAQILDLRPDAALAGGLVPGAISIPLDMVSSFGGWYLKYDRDIVLILREASDAEQAIRLLCRIGYDRIVGSRERLRGLGDQCPTSRMHSQPGRSRT
jgi:hydroxyacylglutathione hydrolase